VIFSVEQVGGEAENDRAVDRRQIGLALQRRQACCARLIIALLNVGAGQCQPGEHVGRREDKRSLGAQASRSCVTGLRVEPCQPRQRLGIMCVDRGSALVSGSRAGDVTALFEDRPAVEMRGRKVRVDSGSAGVGFEGGIVLAEGLQTDAEAVEDVRIFR
jgi:hypothetical protein